MRVLNIFMVTCPHCNKHRLKYGERFFLSAYYPNQCPECSGLYRPSYISIFFVLSLSFAPFILMLHYLKLNYPEWAYYVWLIPWHFFVWGICIRPKKHRKVYLPKSRVLGYMIYLLLPILGLILFFSVLGLFRVGF